MALRRAVARWRCKCGTRIKVIGEIDVDAPLNNQLAPCPNCGDPQRVYVETIISISEDTPEPSSEAVT